MQLVDLKADVLQSELERGNQKSLEYAYQSNFRVVTFKNIGDSSMSHTTFAKKGATDLAREKYIMKASLTKSERKTLTKGSSEILQEKNKTEAKSQLQWDFEENAEDVDEAFDANQGSYHLDEPCAFLHRKFTYASTVRQTAA